MKAHLSTATMTAAILVFAASTLAPTSAMASQSFVLQCTEFIGSNGVSQVLIQNVGAAPVPTGTVSKWQLPQRVVQIQYKNYTQPAWSGIYTFQQPLNPQGTITAFQGSAPAPIQSGGSLPDPADAGSLAMLFAALVPRACTIGVVSLAEQASQVGQFHVVSVIPGTPTGVSATRANVNTVFLTWAGGIATANFYVFDITTASNPPTDYHNWQNPVVVGGNILKATISIPGATKPQTNYYMVCAANTGSTIVRCSQPAVERLVPLAPQQGPLVHPH
jgi:hypothetical protein